jgi:hypothetical protein
MNLMTTLQPISNQDANRKEHFNKSSEDTRHLSIRYGRFGVTPTYTDILFEHPESTNRTEKFGFRRHTQHMQECVLKSKAKCYAAKSRDLRMGKRLRRHGVEPRTARSR